MSKIKDYLEKLLVPSSTIDKLLDEKIELTSEELNDLATNDAADIGKIHAKANPDPKHNEKYIIEIKNLKAGIFKQLQKLGAEMGELSRNKVEEMNTDDFLKSIADPLHGHIEKVKSATDEKIGAELKASVKKISELQDEVDSLTQNFSKKELEIRGEVDKEKQKHLLSTKLSSLDKATKFGVTGKVLEMVIESGRNKINSADIIVDENGALTNSNGGPATYNGKIMRSIDELYKSVYQDAFPVSNGQSTNNVVSGIEIPDKKDAENTNTMAEKMKEAGAI